MGMIREFKEFAVRGNVVDLAVGIIIGAAFGKIVTSLVNDVIMPPIGMLLSGRSVADWKWEIGTDGVTQETINISHGLLLQAVIDFAIVAFVIFLVIKGINRLKRKEEVAAAAPTPPPREEILLEEIRDLLKQR